MISLFFFFKNFRRHLYKFIINGDISVKERVSETFYLLKEWKENKEGSEEERNSGGKEKERKGRI